MPGLLLLSCAVLYFQAAAGPAVQSPQPPPRIVTGVGPSLSQLVADHDWLALEDALRNNAGPDTALYRGLLLNRRGQYEQSLQLLEPMIPRLAAGADRTHEKQARLALANDSFRTFRYRQAAEQYAALDRCCAASLTESERDEAEVPAKILPLLEAAPPQTLELSESFTVPMVRNALGVREVEVWVDGYPSRWLFDPAANFTWLSRSQARRIGLKLTGGDALTVRSITGEPIRVQATVISQLKFGGAFFRNVPAVIYEDADLYDKPHRYQVEGVLAQPLLAALGAITASDDDHLTVLHGTPLTGGAPLFSDGEHLLAGAGAKGAQQLYVIDPGTTGSVLSSRYFDEHAADFTGRSPKAMRLSNEEVPAYTVEALTLDFGEISATFHEIPVLARPGRAELDRVYGTFCGTLREDALDQLASYTFDFRSMRFLVRVHSEQ